MISQTLAALLAFLVFVVPGLAFELLRERRRPILEETAFREASRVGLTSILFTRTALLILSMVRTLHPSWVVDPANWLTSGNRYVAQNLPLVATTTAVLLVISLLLAVMTDFTFRRRAPGHITTGSIWFAVFRQHRPPGGHPWVHLGLVDETEIWGYAGDYTPSESLDNRELLLKQPDLQYRRKGETSNTSLPKWAFVVVRGERISWMKVQYVARTSTDELRLLPPVYRRR